MSSQEKLDELNQETRRFYWLYHEKISRRLRAVLGDELTPVQYLLMGIVSEDGTVPMSEVCERVMMPKQQVTRAVNELEEKGLVTRVRPSGNRRVVWLECTEAARELEGRIGRQTLETLHSVFDSLSDDETEEYVQAMRTVNRLLLQLPGRLSLVGKADSHLLPVGSADSHLLPVGSADSH